MKIIQIFLFGGLFAGFIVETVMLVSTRRELASLRAELADLEYADDDNSDDRTGSKGRAADSAGKVLSQGKGAFGARKNNGGKMLKIPPKFLTDIPLGQPDGEKVVGAIMESEEGRSRIRSLMRSEIEEIEKEKNEQRRERRMVAVEKFTDKVADKFSLNPDQKAELTSIMQNSSQRRDAIRQKIRSGDVSRSEIREEYAAMRKTAEVEIAALIGEDNLKEFTAFSRAEGMPGMGGRWRGRGGRNTNNKPPAKPVAP